LPVSESIRLSVREPRGDQRWSWALTDAEGTLLATHDVSIDRGSTLATAFADPLLFVERGSEPGRRMESEIEHVHVLGDWIGKELLGAVGEAILERAPVTVEVVVPPAIESLMYRPWELARVDGAALVLNGVSFVYVPEGQITNEVAPIGERLRILALFSLPAGERALTLRRERRALVKLVRDMAATGRAVEIAVMQYGVTRDALARKAREQPGWDLLHVSGHGLAGGLLLEGPSGAPDLIDAKTLTDLLRPLHRSVKLTVLSTCDSWAPAAVENLRELDLDAQADDLVRAAAADQRSTNGTTALGKSILDALGCAVLGMRFPVDDMFAARLTNALYTRVLDVGEPLDVALRGALPAALEADDAFPPPLLSIGTPALFGAQAIGLELRAPDLTPDATVDATLAPSLPDEPVRFVGRTRLLSDAGEALSASSDRSGVIFHGMVGIGKSASALELAHRHLATFSATAYWNAKEIAESPDAALADFAHRLDEQFGSLLDEDDLQIGRARSDDDFDTALQKLTALLTRRRLLLVLDDMESLLTENGDWRTERWRRLFAAMTAPHCASRLVMTSRVLPADLDLTSPACLPVHPLSLAETALLAGELPEFSLRMHGADDHNRAVARQVIAASGGHPELLELVDASILDHDEPRAGDRAADGDVSVVDGRSESTPKQFFEELEAWISAAIDRLDPPSRFLLRLLVTLEPEDRVHRLLTRLWSVLAKDHPAEVSNDLDELLRRLDQAGLVDTESSDGLIAMFPGIINFVLTSEGRDESVVATMGIMWVAQADETSVKEVQLGLGEAFVASALRAVPYLLQLGQWEATSAILQRVAHRDRSPATLQLLLVYAEKLLAESDDPAAAQDLIDNLRTRAGADPDEDQLRSAVDAARAKSDPDALLGALGPLVTYLVFNEGAEEALQLCDEMEQAAADLDAGPWTHLDIEGRRLRAREVLGQHLQVLQQGRKLRERMATLPIEREANERDTPWGVRERVLATMRSAARTVGEIELETELADEYLASQRARGALTWDRAHAAMEQAGTLYAAGRYDEAEEVLDEAQASFSAFDDARHLAMIFDTRGAIAEARDESKVALGFSQTALRLAYSLSAPTESFLASLHVNAGVHLAHLGEIEAAAAQFMGAALLCDVGKLSSPYGAAIRRMDKYGTTDWRPVHFVALAKRVDQLPNSRFGALMRDRYEKSYLDHRLTDHIYPQIKKFTSELRELEWWDPYMQDFLAAHAGREDAGALFAQGIAEQEGNARWQPLLAALRRLQDGERGDDLTEDLDQVSQVLMAALLRDLEYLEQQQA
jgi:tetratricopeptide (TPR) repeat protein